MFALRPRNWNPFQVKHGNIHEWCLPCLNKRASIRSGPRPCCLVPLTTSDFPRPRTPRGTPMNGVFRQSTLYVHIRRAIEPVRFLSLFSSSTLRSTPTGSPRRMCLLNILSHDGLVTRRGRMPSMIRSPKPCRAVPLSLSHGSTSCRWVRGSDRLLFQAHLFRLVH